MNGFKCNKNRPETEDIITASFGAGLLRFLLVFYENHTGLILFLLGMLEQNPEWDLGQLMFWIPLLCGTLSIIFCFFLSPSRLHMVPLFYSIGKGNRTPVSFSGAWKMTIRVKGSMRTPRIAQRIWGALHALGAVSTFLHVYVSSSGREPTVQSCSELHK